MQVSMAQIQEKIPTSCHYDPLRWAPHDWSGSHLEILDEENIPIPDRIFIVFHLISESLQRRYALTCVGIYQESFSVTDPHIIDAVSVCEDYLSGSKQLDDLTAARSSALSVSKETQNQGLFITAKAVARACAVPVVLPHIDPSCMEQLLQALYDLTADL